MMSNPIILYLAYGGVDYLNQALYSILTLRHYCPDLDQKYKVVVYTDSPEFFEGRCIECRQVSAEQVQQWRGCYNYVHRFKIEMIRDANRSYGVPLLYLDSDTYWQASPEALFSAIEAGSFVMNSYEGLLSETFHPVLHRFLSSDVGRKFGISPQSPMWNSGIIGLPACATTLLGEVLKLTDDLFRLCYERNWLEQFAFTHVLSERSSLVAATRELNHYWEYNMQAQTVLREFFAERVQQDDEQLIVDAIALTADLESRSLALQPQQNDYWRSRWERSCRSFKKRWTHLRILRDNKIR
ncbi:MAG: hypothetical protein ABI210_05720 [Abditibacteriaceae bacterium]